MKMTFEALFFTFVLICWQHQSLYVAHLHIPSSGENEDFSHFCLVRTHRKVTDRGGGLELTAQHHNLDNFLKK